MAVRRSFTMTEEKALTLSKRHWVRQMGTAPAARGSSSSFYSFRIQFFGRRGNTGFSVVNEQKQYALHFSDGIAQIHQRYRRKIRFIQKEAD